MIQKRVGFTLEVREAPGPVDFFPAIDPGAVAVDAGAVATYLVSFATAGGYANPISLAVLGLPTGAVAAFDVNPATPDKVVTLTIWTEGVAAGKYDLQVEATEVAG